MDSSATQTIKRLMSEVLGIPEAEIDNSVTMENTDSWDSLRHMDLVVALEENLHIEFAPKESMGLVSYEDIQRIIAAKRASI